MRIEIDKWEERFFLIPTLSFSWEDGKTIEFIWLRWGLEINW